MYQNSEKSQCYLGSFVSVCILCAASVRIVTYGAVRVKSGKRFPFEVCMSEDVFRQRTKMISRGGCEPARQSVKSEPHV